ncbi:MAG: FtsX-like permease family protein, partial [Kordiimonas sp.]
LKNGASIETVNQRLPEFTNANIEIPPGFGGADTKASDFVKYSTQPITDLQLNPRAPAGSEMKPTGSMEGVYIFSAIAGLILLIACINFMNLATAKSTKRAREVALRKVLGAHRSQLIIQFLGESILVAFIGLILGIVLVEACLPTFGEFVSKDLYFSLTDGMTLMILSGLVLVVGVLGGVYPALILSGFLPARVLKANKSAETSGSASLRNVLVIMQFAISIGLIIATSVVYGQKYYATTMDPGFNKNNLLVVRDLIRNGSRDQRDAFKEEVARLPGVVSASYSFDRPSSGNNSNRTVTLPDSDAGILIGYQSVGYDFFETYEVPIIAGRNYSREYSLDGMPSGEGAEPGDQLQGTMVLNEAAVRRLGYASNEDAIGKSFSIGVGQDIDADMTIIGVVPDLNFQSLRSIIRPEMFAMEKDIFSNLTVRFEGNGSDMASRIEQVWNSMITTVPYRYEYVDESMAAEFEAEEAQSIMLGVFAGLAILIACLGLYGLASFTAERRTKEIGIRKVMGARVRDVVQLLVWQFSKPVLVANLIAWPVAVWGMLKWLETFPYRMDTWMLVPLCIGAGFVALAIAWATVGGNAAKVARSNPIKALRYE